MYIPDHFREDDPLALRALIDAHPLATLVSIIEGVPVATHLPLLLDDGPEGPRLIGHLARANPHWTVFGSEPALAIFSGPHAYISPTHYEKQESVPTWNFATVHVYGVPRVVTGEAAEDILYRLVAAMEPGYWDHWRELSPKYREGMLHGIVAFELPVQRWEGKFKLSQNRSATERQRIGDALLQSDDTAAQGIGILMAVRNPP